MNNEYRQPKNIGALIFGIIWLGVAIWAIIYGYSTRFWEGQWKQAMITSIISFVFSLPFIIPNTRFGQELLGRIDQKIDQHINQHNEVLKKRRAERLILIKKEPKKIELGWLKNTVLFILGTICVVIVLAIIWFILKGLYGLLLFGIRQI